MGILSTTKLQISITHPDVFGGMKTRIDNREGVETMEISERDHMVEVKETTGVGRTKRRRRKQGLEDIADRTLSFEANLASANDLSRVFETIRDDDDDMPVEIEQLYETGNSDSDKYLVVGVKTGTPVGEFVKTTVALSSWGEWTEDRV